jgi:formylglycine-generating enzyme required for sulfatase activity
MQTRTIIAAAAAMVLAAGMANADVFNMGGNLTSLSFVTVGNPGNAADANDGEYPLGSVGYTYQMGTYDVTAEQYCQFLNAVATHSDPYGLYSTSMSGGPGSNACGIHQTGGPGNYSYNTTSGYSVNNGNFPVNDVSWGDAARFCNWLANGQPTTGVENLTTTENGSYYLNGALTNSALLAVSRAAGAKYVIPTASEWYKAAYYDPTLLGGSGGYWKYPTQSNTLPSNGLSATGTNNANYYNGSTYTDPADGLTVVGAFADSPGHYGTYDMGGDVGQWSDTTDVFGTSRIVGGGWYGGSDQFLQSEQGYGYNPARESSDVGFRVVDLAAPVPEPLTVIGCLMGLAGLGRYVRNRLRSC